MKLLFIFGAGYSAAALAALLAPEGWRVLGTQRAPVSAQAGDRIERLVWNASDPWPEAALAADALLFSIPPGAEGDPALLGLPVGLRFNAGWAGYLSTTGVYGDLAGGWAFEETPTRPQSPQARRRALAEAQALASPLPMHIFRLPGIYGPGRSALDRLRAGNAQSVIKPGHVFSRIHVADIAGILARSLAAPNPGRVYNVADDRPAPQHLALRHAAALLGLPPPPEIAFEAAMLEPEAQRFYAESRRVANARIKAELGVRLRFPSFVEGFEAILAAEGGGRPESATGQTP